MNSILVLNIGELPLLKMNIDLGERHRLFRASSSFRGFDNEQSNVNSHNTQDIVTLYF